MFTGHLSDDDTIGANLVLLPKWPLDKEDSASISISKILTIASFIDEPTIGRGKTKATGLYQSDQVPLTIVLKY